MNDWLANCRRLTLSVALAAAFGGASQRASAKDEAAPERFLEHDHDQDLARRARERGEIRPLEEIAPLVRARFPGEVAQIELEREHGVWIYEFKMIDPVGRFREIKIDAATGKLIETVGE